jgi:hypothetical protein
VVLISLFQIIYGSLHLYKLFLPIYFLTINSLSLRLVLRAKEIGDATMFGLSEKFFMKLMLSHSQGLSAFLLSVDNIPHSLLVSVDI